MRAAKKSLSDIKQAIAATAELVKVLENEISQGERTQEEARSNDTLDRLTEMLTTFPEQTQWAFEARLLLQARIAEGKARADEDVNPPSDYDGTEDRASAMSASEEDAASTAHADDPSWRVSRRRRRDGHGKGRGDSDKGGSVSSDRARERSPRRGGPSTGAAGSRTGTIA